MEDPPLAFNAAPDAGESGIWQSDAGIAADAEGNVYAVTGNGKFTAASGGRDYGDSVLKLGLDKGALTVRDYFTPFNEAHLNSEDADLGSSGPVLLPDQPGPHPHEAGPQSHHAIRGGGCQRVAVGGKSHSEDNPLVVIPVGQYFSHPHVPETNAPFVVSTVT